MMHRHVPEKNSEEIIESPGGATSSGADSGPVGLFQQPACWRRSGQWGASRETMIAITETFYLSNVEARGLRDYVRSVGENVF
jgi:hypothetical protein